MWRLTAVAWDAHLARASPLKDGITRPAALRTTMDQQWFIDRRVERNSVQRGGHSDRSSEAGSLTRGGYTNACPTALFTQNVLLDPRLGRSLALCRLV